MGNVKYAALLLIGCGLVHAETEVKTLGDLDRLQSGRVYYDAQAAFNKAKRAAEQSDTAAAPSMAVPVSSVPAGNGVPAPVAITEGRPWSLEKIAGAVATLNLPDGSSTQARVGDTVGGEFRVVSVSTRGVILKRLQDGRLVTLN